ncbi:hypothetical protein KFE25_002348 [Diacronema lutheri]|uniref:UDP N-acetylglucosamine O-acyltransferase C-terminal domain-containing protein n=2 Tax=Diacronema lutheri TaxID=2081491 RepID=A0A8J5XBN0_DIALT|nr:hypothetical protein KFE25_002348 [Diacronema lutheri]
MRAVPRGRALASVARALGAHGPAQVHPTAVVHAAARLEPGVTVGPFCVVGPGAHVRAGASLVASVHVAGRTDIGEGTTVFPFACLGSEPQDRKHAGEPTRLRIGARCVVREHVTAHAGTSAGGGLTAVGDGCLLMAGAHVAHDCDVGAGAILANAVLLAGHVRIGARAIVGGGSALHQRVAVGAGAMVGGGSIVAHDVPPYTLARGNRALLVGVNLVGLRRAHVGRAEAAALLRAFRAMFGGHGSYFAPALDPGGASLAERAEHVLRAHGGAPVGELVAELARFVLDPARARPVCAAEGAPRARGRGVGAVPAACEEMECGRPS